MPLPLECMRPILGDWRVWRRRPRRRHYREHGAREREKRGARVVRYGATRPPRGCGQPDTPRLLRPEQLAVASQLRSAVGRAQSYVPKAPPIKSHRFGRRAALCRRLSLSPLSGCRLATVVALATPAWWPWFHGTVHYECFGLSELQSMYGRVQFPVWVHPSFFSNDSYITVGGLTL